jgi:polyisoprenoid-binding protein YceI
MKSLSSSFGTLVLFFGIQAAASPGVVVDVVLNPVGDFKAKTNEVTGSAYQDGDVVRADLIKVKLTNLKTGMKLRDQHAREKYLHTDKYPEAILTRAIGKGGAGKAMLKIRDVEREVRGKYKVDGQFLKAEFPIKLSDYNITGIRYMGVGVEDEVRIQITVPLEKVPPSGKAPASVAPASVGRGENRPSRKER